MKPKVVYRYTMQERGIYQLTDPRTVTNLIPAEFIAFFKTSRSVEDIIDAIDRQSREAVIHETLRLERHNLRSERKQPWGTHTRRPFRNVLDNVKPSLREMLRLAEEVAFELGMPYEPKPEGTRGRPTEYDPRKLGAILMVKGIIGLRDLAVRVEDCGYDPTIKGTGKAPSKSVLHEALCKIPEEWLRKAVAMLDERVKSYLAKFGENQDIFGFDGSALTCATFQERIVGGVRRLVREVYSFTALIRLSTNTIRGIEPHTNRLKPFLPLIPEGSVVIGDPEFDVEENYRDAWSHGLEVQIKQRQTPPRHKPYRKKARRRFDHKKYRRRKAAEIPFGNMYQRGYKMRYTVNKYKGALLIACHHNIIACFRYKKWAEMFIVIE